MNKEKRDQPYGLILLKLIAVIFTLGWLVSCEQYAWTNPLDPKTTLSSSSWKTEKLKIVALNDRNVLLSWEMSEANIEGYQIFRSINSETPLPYKTTGVETQFTDEDLKAGVLYNYLVHAYAGENLGEASNSVFVTTEFPPLEQLQSISINDTTVQISWSFPDNYLTQYDVEGLKLERKINSSAYCVYDTISIEVSTYFDTGVSVDTQYKYRISAFNVVNTSQTTRLKPEITYLIPPTGLEALVINEQSIRLEWLDNDLQADGYKLERLSGDSTVLVSILPISATSFLDEDLIYGELYHYQLYTFTSRSVSSKTTLLVPILLQAAAPTLVDAFGRDDQSIQIYWQDHCSFESGYKVFRDDGAGLVQMAELGPNQTEYLDENLIHGVSYQYHVFANINGYTGAILELWQEPTTPNPVNLLAEAISDNYTHLTWKDRCSTELEYWIERDEGDGFVTIAQLPENSENYTDFAVSNLSNNYSYRVKLMTSAQTEYWSEAFSLVNVMTDYDGNHYTLQKVGDQYWTTTNLRVTHYRNGDEIPNLTVHSDWEHTIAGAYSYYNNQMDYVDRYGAIYNRHAVTDHRGLAPEGWHIATAEEFQEVYSYNELLSEYRSLFIQNCSGLRSYNGTFVDELVGAYYWCVGSEYTFGFTMYCGSGNTYPGHWNSNPHWGLSVRCVKDSD